MSLKQRCRYRHPSMEPMSWSKPMAAPYEAMPFHGLVPRFPWPTGAAAETAEGPHQASNCRELVPGTRVPSPTPSPEPL